MWKKQILKPLSICFVYSHLNINKLISGSFGSILVFVSFCSFVMHICGNSVHIWQDCVEYRLLHLFLAVYYFRNGCVLLRKKKLDHLQVLVGFSTLQWHSVSLSRKDIIRISYLVWSAGEADRMEVWRVESKKKCARKIEDRSLHTWDYTNVVIKRVSEGHYCSV